MAISGIWTIQNLSAGWPAPLPFADPSLLLQGLRIEYPAAGSHKATFTAEGALVDSAFKFNYGERVVIFRKGTPWFVGWVTAPASAESQGERIQYEISNDWWMLAEMCDFQQVWKIGNTYYPRVILGQAVNVEEGTWSALNADAVIREVLQYAIDVMELPIQIGLIASGPIPPMTERTCIKCGEAMTMMMKWLGACTIHWDYTTLGYGGSFMPTIHILGRQNPGAPCIPQSIQITDSRLERDGLKIKPAYQVRPPFVVVWYEQQNTDDAQTATTYYKDQFPAGNALVPGTLNHIFELGGSKTQWEKNNVHTAVIPTSPDEAGGDESTLMSWLVTHDPIFAGLTPANLKYTSGTFIANLVGATQGTFQNDQNGNEMQDFTTDDLPNELKAGSKLAPWQVKPAGGSGITTPDDVDSGYHHVADVIITFHLSYDFTANAISQDELDAAFRVFGAANARTAAVQVKATNMSTQVYKNLTGATLGEQPQTGIAESLYLSLNQLNYEGAIALIENECSGLFRLNNLLNIVGSANAAWAAMNATIKSVVEEIDAGRTRIELGLPAHLDAQSLLDLAKASRVAVATDKLNERASGANSRSTEIDRTSTESGQGSGHAGDTANPGPWSPINNGDGTINLNPASFLYDQHATKQTIQYLDNAFTPSIGDMIYLHIPLNNDGSINTDGEDGPELQQDTSDFLDETYPAGINSDDPANPYQQDLFQKIMEFVDPSDSRKGDLYTLNSGSVIKIVQLCRTHLAMYGANVANQGIYGVMLVASGAQTQPTS
jgi:hypothetical protein